MSLFKPENRFEKKPKISRPEQIQQSLSTISESIFIYPGTFDPFTLGHRDIAERACKMCAKLIIAISDSRVAPMFSLDRRVEVAKKTVETIDADNIEVHGFVGLLPDFARSIGARLVVRGVRNNSDYEDEAFLMRNYKHYNKNIDMILLPAEAQFLHISASITRELLRHNADITGYVADEAIPLLKK